MTQQLKKVLFVTEDAPDLAKMAEGLLSNASDQFEVFSAVIDASALSPFTNDVMQEMGVEFNPQLAELNDYETIQFDYVITICDQVTPLCIEFARDVHIVHWQVENPLNTQGNNDQVKTAFEQARDALAIRVQAWLDSQTVL